jgi:hypothetical protein
MKPLYQALTGILLGAILAMAGLGYIEQPARGGQYDDALAVQTGTGSLEGYTYTTTLALTADNAQVFSSGSTAYISTGGTGTYIFPNGSTTLAMTNGTTTFTNTAGSTAVTGSTWTLTPESSLVSVSGSATITTSTAAVYNTQLNLPNLGTNGSWVRGGLVLDATSVVAANWIAAAGTIPNGAAGLSSSNTVVVYGTASGLWIH